MYRPPFGTFAHLYLEIGTTEQMLAFSAAAPLLRPALLGAVTRLWLRANYATADTALRHASHMSTLQVLRVQVPPLCAVASGVFAQLSRLAALRHLVVLGAWQRGLELFPDEQWAALASGLRRLRTLAMTTCLRLSPLALPILGAHCREAGAADSAAAGSACARVAAATGTTARGCYERNLGSGWRRHSLPCAYGLVCVFVGPRCAWSRALVAVARFL